MAALLVRAGDDPVDRLLSRLECVKQTGPDRWIARCPAHDDRHPSLSVRETGDGTLLVRCWAGCSAAEVVHSASLTLRDLFPTTTADHHRGPLPKRSRWDRADVWRCVAHEAAVSAVAASAAAGGATITPEDAERAWLAADRLADALAEMGIEP